MANGKVLVVGSFNMDMVVGTERIPRPGETVLGGEFFTVHGGKGANQAVASARLGADVTFAGRVGRDAFGEAALRSLAHEKISTEFVSQDPSKPTGVAMIVVNKAGENCIVVAPGANAAFTALHATELHPAIERSDVVLCQLETPLEAVEEVMRQACEQGKTTILNPAPAQNLPASLLKWVSILTPNETEAESLTGVVVSDNQSAARAAEILHERGVKTVILTLGHRGAYVSNPEIREVIPTRAVQAIDTTAAGDVFSGTLAAALAEKQSLTSAVRMACEAATISVTRRGAQTSIPYRHEVVM